MLVMKISYAQIAMNSSHVIHNLVTIALDVDCVTKFVLKTKDVVYVIRQLRVRGVELMLSIAIDLSIIVSSVKCALM